jgi:hypothetical protein
VKRGVWLFVVFLIGSVFFVSAVPQVDVPETSYNEVDTPVNQAPPVVQGMRFVRPAVNLIVVPKRVFETRFVLDAHGHDLQSIAPRFHQNARGIRDLLCTLLI